MNWCRDTLCAGGDEQPHAACPSQAPRFVEQTRALASGLAGWGLAVSAVRPVSNTGDLIGAEQGMSQEGNA